MSHQTVSAGVRLTSHAQAASRSEQRQVSSLSAALPKSSTPQPPSPSDQVEVAEWLLDLSRSSAKESVKNQPGQAGTVSSPLSSDSDEPIVRQNSTTLHPRVTSEPDRIVPAATPTPLEPAVQEVRASYRAPSVDPWADLKFFADVCARAPRLTRSHRTPSAPQTGNVGQRATPAPRSARVRSIRRAQRGLGVHRTSAPQRGIAAQRGIRMPGDMTVRRRLFSPRPAAAQRCIGMHNENCVHCTSVSPRGIALPPPPHPAWHPSPPYYPYATIPGPPPFPAHAWQHMPRYVPPAYPTVAPARHPARPSPSPRAPAANAWRLGGSAPRAPMPPPPPPHPPPPPQPPPPPSSSPSSPRLARARVSKRRRARVGVGAASSYCHICNGAEKRGGPRHVPCGNVALGSCTKAICCSCFVKITWTGKVDIDEARAQGRAWKCPHCTGACRSIPQRIPSCKYYLKASHKRRLAKQGVAVKHWEPAGFRKEAE